MANAFGYTELAHTLGNAKLAYAFRSATSLPNAFGSSVFALFSSSFCFCMFVLVERSLVWNVLRLIHAYQIDRDLHGKVMIGGAHELLHYCGLSGLHIFCLSFFECSILLLNDVLIFVSHIKEFVSGLKLLSRMENIVVRLLWEFQMFAAFSGNIFSKIFGFIAILERLSVLVFFLFFYHSIFSND